MSSGSYRYGFNGQEKSDEIKGSGKSYTAEFWEYDPRLGRRWNVDPIRKEYESPFAAFANNPIWFVDKFGLDTTINGRLYHDLPEVSVSAQFRPKSFQTGNALINGKDDDLSKKYHDVEINTGLYDKSQPYKRGDILDHFNRFNSVFKMGISLESDQAQMEGSSLVSHFETGKGALLPPFGNESEMSKILSNDAQFVDMVKQFEKNLVEHYNNSGSLSGFNGNDVLRVARAGKYMKDTWFMHTVMGGFQQVDAQIRIIKSDQIQIRYTIWDHFGAGTSDAGSNLPGLPSLYWLQHNSTKNNILMSGWFSPFVWGVEVDRTISR